MSGRDHARVLAALWALEGKAWLEVQGEIHEAYKQAPFFILLGPDASPLEAHRQFWRVLERETLGDYRPSVSYKALAGDHVLRLGYFDGEAAMKDGLDPERWGAPERQELEQATLFRHVREIVQPPAPKRGGKRRGGKGRK